MESEMFIENYKLLCQAGDGAQGKVFLAEKDSKNYIIKTYFPNPKAMSYFAAQSNILSFLNSPYIIKMVECFPQANVQEGKGVTKKPAIVLEFAERGDLFKIIYKGRLCEQASRTLFKQMIYALRSLKQAEIAHLDIKMENILLDQNYNIKIGDFGYAKRTLDSAILTSYQGTKGYIAPEIYDQHYRGDKVDLFAAGVVLFYMVTRMVPFSETTRSQIDYNLIRKEKFQDFWKKFDKYVKLSLSLKRLINALLNADPEKRPTLSQLQADQWVNDKSFTQEQLKNYLEPRYKKLQDDDKETMNIRKALLQKRNKILENAQKNYDNKDRSGQFRSNDKQTFAEELANFSLQLTKLPQKVLYGAKYYKATPKQLLLWLHQYLHQIKKQKKNLFNAAEEVQLIHFTLKPKHQIIELSFDVEMHYQNESWTVELELQGEMVQWQGEISINWKKKTGNDFWLSQIREQLYTESQIFFKAQL